MIHEEPYQIPWPRIHNLSQDEYANAERFERERHFHWAAVQLLEHPPRYDWCAGERAVSPVNEPEEPAAVPVAHLARDDARIVDAHIRKHARNLGKRGVEPPRGLGVYARGLRCHVLERIGGEHEPAASHPTLQQGWPSP